LFSLRVEVKASIVPSGDHCGLVEDFSPKVSWTAPVPSAFAT
jgi:hypothetical protein